MSDEARQDFAERRAWKMSLEEYLEPMLYKLKKDSGLSWEFDVRYKDGTLIRVKLHARVSRPSVSSIARLIFFRSLSVMP